MKLIPQQLASMDIANQRQRPVQTYSAQTGSDKSSEQLEPISAIAPVSRNKPSGSYSNASQQAHVKFESHNPVSTDLANSPRNTAAVNYYAYTSTLDADSGELIGIDTYA